MDAVIKTKWTDALRSGKYQQGVGALRSGDNKFCCLGVLCDVAEAKGLSMEVIAPEDNSQVWKYDDRVGGLPQSVQGWAGMDDSMGSRMINDNFEGPYRPCLADLNDEGRTFEQIADIIEKEF